MITDDVVDKFVDAYLSMFRVIETPPRYDRDELRRYFRRQLEAFERTQFPPTKKDPTP